jgi:thiamine transport system ATP-binding protein
MLQLERLILRQADWALSADWQVEPGARVAIIGPSGAGKSTLLLAIGGFFPITEGRVLWNGADLAPLDPGQRPISFLFQDQNLFPHLTIAQNLALGLGAGLRVTPEVAQRIDDVLTRVGLSGTQTRKPAQLSGGQQGRAALARALLRRRPILALDEPFSALGPALKAEMLDLVAEIATETGAMVLMVTHDPNDAKRFASQTILVADGVAQSPEATATLFSAPPTALRAYLGS